MATLISMKTRLESGRAAGAQKVVVAVSATRTVFFATRRSRDTRDRDASREVLSFEASIEKAQPPTSPHGYGRLRSCVELIGIMYLCP